MSKKINWPQVGQDFAQKYQGTWCRYVSPITRDKEIFLINEVVPQSHAGPNISLHNSKHGELHLTYHTEAELDFSFPEMRNFQHKKRAMRFVRLHDRQYKKGICNGTAKVLFPYSVIAGTLYPEINAETLESAFQPLVPSSIEQALSTIEREGQVSAVLSPNLSIGCGNEAGSYWLWFQTEPVAVLEGKVITMKVATFKQEIVDFLRDTGDYARTVV